MNKYTNFVIRNPWGSILACLLGLSIPSFGVGPTITVYDASAGLQTDRPITFGSCFKQGEYPNTPKPIIGGVAPGSSDWQVDMKKRWDADSSAKCGIVSFNNTIAGNSFITVTFVDNANGNNTGYLDATGMANFNNGGAGWGGKMTVGFNSTTTDFDAKSMLADDDPGGHPLPGASNWGNDERNDYWLIGPVVTAVLVRDHTSASKWDVGALYDGSTMAGPSGSGTKYSGNCSGTPFPGCYSSIDGWHILYFYPKNSSVRDDMIIEDTWIGRWQDQMFDLTYYTGATPSAQLTQVGARKVTDAVVITNSNVVTSATASFVSGDVGMPVTFGTFLSTTICSVTNGTTVRLCEIANATGAGQTMVIGVMHAGQRYRKTFWTGAGAPGDVLIDWDLAYMATVGVFPPYDTAVTASPDSVNAGAAQGKSYNNSTLGDYATFSGSTQTFSQNGTCPLATEPCRWDDSGDRGGTGGFVQGFAGNSEGAPTQLEPSYYLHNMGNDCGTANGLCAKAWWMLTGTRGAKHSSLATSIVGGAGVLNNMNNVPFNARESAVVLGYYSAAQADKDAVPGTSFGTVTGAAIGKPLSRFNRITLEFSAAAGILGNPTGSTSSLGGWTAGGCDHMLDYAFEGALLLGDYYKVEEEQMWASYCSFSTNQPGQTPQEMNGYYSYFGTAIDGLRAPAWSLQQNYRAALVSPDGTPQQSYYDSVVKSNAEITEGLMNLVNGTGGVVSSLTPTNHRACNGWSYNYTTANRWEWGRCTAASMCLNTGSACPTAGVTQVLHNLSPGSCTGRISDNNGLKAWSVTVATSVSTHTTLTFISNDVPVSGDTLTIVGATLNWAGLNGNWVVSNVTGTPTIDVPFDSSAVVGALTGQVTMTKYGFGLITGASIANNSVLTGNTMPNAFFTNEIVNATGTGWTGLNGVKTFTPVSMSTTTATIGLDSHTFSGAPGGTIYYNGNSVQLNLFASFDEPWMRSYYCLVMGETHYAGISWLDNISHECNLLYTEMLLDNTYNPYLIGTYAIGTKDPTGSQPCNAYSTSGGPYISTYAAQKAAYIPAVGGMTTYNTSGQSPAGPFTNGTACDDHSYQLSGRAASQFIGGVTGSCTQGACTGADAITLVDAITPYFNNTPTNSTGCGSADSQIKFALQPPAGTVTITACNSLSPSSATIAILGTQSYTADCTYSDSSTGPCTPSLTSGTPSVATVSGVIATGVSGGSSTISATAGGFACGNTSALTVTAATSFSSFKGLTLKGVTVK